MDTTRIIIAHGEKSIADRCRDAVSGQSRFRIIGDARAPESLLKLVAEWQPDLVLLDAGLSDSSQIFARIRELNAEIRILVVAGNGEMDFVANALEQGAHGCVTRDCSPESLLRAIDAVCRGELWASRGALAQLLSKLLQTVAEPAAETVGTDGSALTGREQEILLWVSRGLTNKEVARRLGISDLTVKSHLQNIYAKLGVHRRLQVVLERTVGFR